MAVTLAEMETAPSPALIQLENMAVTFGMTADDVRAAAVTIASFPQPQEESVEHTERARPIREMLGVTSAHDQLAAAITGRAWLEQLADSEGVL
ncbi:MAG: hypothetical protein M3Y91_17850 [Actinomycetota bacterium]|nr:hypothetical protein [Actinomycetota bacterium]